MEIKTCEQYVLNRVMELEEGVESLQTKLDCERDIIAEMTSIFDNIKRIFSGANIVKGDKYEWVSVPSVFDEEDVEFIKDFLDIKAKMEV